MSVSSCALPYYISEVAITADGSEIHFKNINVLKWMRLKEME